MFSDILLRLEKIEMGDEDPRFYFVWHKKLFDILLGLLLASLIVWTLVFIFAVNRPEALPWAQTSDGRTVAVHSLDEPKYTNDAVKEWSESAVKSVYNYSFNNYKEQLLAAKPYMSPSAWKMFEVVWDNTIKQKVVDQKIQVSAAVDSAEMEGFAIIGGVSTWKIKVPAMISYVAGSATETKKTTFHLTIQRQVSYTNPKGLWITELIEE
jgi:hypothetical protein